MARELAAMLVLFVVTLSVSVAGLAVLPSWSLVFGSMAGISGLGAGVAGYAIRQE
jgi:hypothetical protein